jgi:hypothetical protein
MRNLVIGALVAIAVAYFVGYTAPGHRLLNATGFTTACSSSDCG